MFWLSFGIQATKQIQAIIFRKESVGRLISACLIHRGILHMHSAIATPFALTNVEFCVEHVLFKCLSINTFIDDINATLRIQSPAWALQYSLLHGNKAVNFFLLPPGQIKRI